MDNKKIINLLTDIEDITEIANDYINMYQNEEQLKYKLQFCVEIIYRATLQLREETRNNTSIDKSIKFV